MQDATDPAMPSDQTGPPPAPASGPWSEALLRRAPASPHVDASGVVSGNVPCRRCSYNLRGLAVSARCPECAAPVGVSVHGPLLRYSEPAWVDGLARGAGLAFWGILVSIGVGIVGSLLTPLLGPWIGQSLSILGGLVYVYGAWLLTEPDPSGVGEDQYGKARQIIRLALIVGLAQNVLTIVVQSGRLTPGMMIAFGAVAVAAGLVGLVGQFAMLRYLERLALRIPEPTYAKRARFLFWAYGGTMAAMLVFGGAALLVGVIAAQAGRGAGGGAAGAGGGPAGGAFGGGAMTWLAGLGCLAGLAFIAFLVFGIMWMVLLYRLKLAFGEQARVAGQVWTAGEAASA